MCEVPVVLQLISPRSTGTPRGARAFDTSPDAHRTGLPYDAGTPSTFLTAIDTVTFRL